MTNPALPSPEILRQLLRYEPETGKLFWLPRAPDMFEETSGYSRERRCQRWNSRHAGREALNHRSSRGYLTGAVLGVSCKAHRVIWAMQTGEWPENIDHLNGERADNRWTNLRSVDHSENMKNRKLSPNNKSGVHGVYFAKSHQRWIARIVHNERRIGLGSYRNLEDAVKARREAEKAYGYQPTHGRTG